MTYSVNPWWTAPVWQIPTGFDSAFNQELEQEIYSIGQALGNGSDVQTSLWDYSRPCLDQLKTYIQQSVQHHVINSIPEARALRIKTEYSMGWVNVKEPGGMIEAHAHNDCSIAATYYVRAKKNCGDLILLNSADIYADSGAFAGSHASTLNHLRIEPVEGLLVFFPAYVLHEVQTNSSNDLRISLSTDLRQVIDPDAPNAMVLKSWAQSFQQIAEWPRV